LRNCGGGEANNREKACEVYCPTILCPLRAAQGAFGADFYDRYTRTIVGTMLWTEYRPVIIISPKRALGSHEIRPIHSASTLGQSILTSLIMKHLSQKGKSAVHLQFSKLTNLQYLNLKS